MTIWWTETSPAVSSISHHISVHSSIISEINRKRKL
jgi:hypothetical protein